MKTPSFKVQLTLTSVLLSGIVLVVFGMIAWTLIYGERMRSLDQELELSGQRILNRFRGPQEIRLLASGVRELMDRMVGPGEAVRFESPAGDLLWVSSSWPDQVERADLFPDGEPDPFWADEDEERGLEEGEFGLDDIPPFGRGEGGPPMGRMEGMGPPPAVGGPGPARRFRGLMREQNRPGRPRPWLNPHIFTLKPGGSEWRIGVFETPQLRLFLAINLEGVNRDLAGIRTSFLVALPFALLLIAAGGLLIARQALVPVRTLTRAAERITARGLDQRISDVSSAPEFRRLIQVFNEMLDRLETSFGQAIRFSADASHELKTPLTVMQGEIEQAMHAAENAPEQQRVLNNLMEQAQRLKDITRRLLLLSQADSGRLPLSLEDVDLSEELETLAEDAGAMAETAGLEFRSRIPAGCMIHIDVNMVRMAIMNLLSNAVKYNVAGGYVDCRLLVEASWARLRISNSGPGIPKEIQAQVFERFHRGYARKVSPTEGFGLGLGLAREIARAHGGDVVLVESNAEETVFELVLPRNG